METFADAASDYLERHQVYELFQNMLRNLAIHQPKQPIQYLIDMLRQPSEQLRVVVAGPSIPGLCSRSKQVARIANEFNLVPLRINEIIQEEVESKSPLGLKAKDYLEQQRPLPDALLTAMVVGRTSRSDAQSRGWVLEGYPETQQQARSLQAAGCLANKFIYLDVPQDTLRVKLFEMTSAAEASREHPESSKLLSSILPGIPAGVEPTSPLAAPAIALAAQRVEADIPIVQRVEKAIEHLQARLTGLAQAYVDVCHVVTDSTLDSGDASAVSDEICRILRQPQPSAAPRRSRRILLLGPVGAGKSTVARELASRFDLVHVSVGSLLRSDGEKGTQRQQLAMSYVDMGEPIPDHIVCPLVLERLAQEDCRTRGWVLEGFPRTLTQATALARAGVLPSRCIFLECPDNVALDRLSGIRYDPITDEFVNTNSDEKMGIDQSRLIQIPRYTPAVLRAVLNHYRQGVDPLKNVYANISIEIDSSKPSREVVNSAVQFVDSRL